MAAMEIGGMKSVRASGSRWTSNTEQGSHNDRHGRDARHGQMAHVPPSLRDDDGPTGRLEMDSEAALGNMGTVNRGSAESLYSSLSTDK